jgi:hypothetical protein
MNIERFSTNPLISPETGKSIGENINGPSLIRVPDFIKNPLGRYYLYFAHHQGKHIRMAYSDRIEGPYLLYDPGVLLLEKTLFSSHIASPDVHIDYERKEIFMIYHGCGFDRTPNSSPWSQVSCYARSKDGLNFISDSLLLAPSYLRIFYHRGYWYGCDGGSKREWYRAKEPQGPYEKGDFLEIPEEVYPGGMGSNDLNIRRMRHLAFDTSRLEENRLDIYYSNVGDSPERIRRVSVDISGDWSSWHGRNLTEVLRSETILEGADLPIETSESGARHEPVHQLRDPYIFIEDGKTYLLYSHAGERGLSGACLKGVK